MKVVEKSRSWMSAVIIAASLTPGLIVFFWQMQVLSFSRLARTSLILFPLVLLFTLHYSHFFSTHFVKNKWKPAVLSLAAGLIISLLAAPRSSSSLHYLAAAFLTAVMFAIIGAAVIQLSERLRINLTRWSFQVLLAITGLLGLAIFLYLALYTRLYGDDFCFIIWMRADGFLTTLYNFYFNWSGRLFSDIFMFALTPLESSPFILIALLVAVTYIVLHRLRITQTSKPGLWTISAVLFLPYAVFTSLPDPYKSLYWISNTQLIFPVSLVFLLFIGYMAHGFTKGFTPGWKAKVAAYLLAMAVGAGHEVYVPALLMITGSLFLYACIRRSLIGRVPLSVSLWALAGALTGTLILLIAPGNYARMAAQNYPPTPGVLSAIGMSLEFFSEYFLIRRLQNWDWLMILSALILGLFASTCLPRSWKLAFTILVTTLVSAWATFLVSAFAMSQFLPMRTQFITVLLLVFGLFAVGATLPRPPSHPAIVTAMVSVLLLLLFVFPPVIARDYRMVAPMRQFAQDWDQRDELLNTTDAEPYAISIPWDSSEQQLHCVADYYSK